MKSGHDAESAVLNASYRRRLLPGGAVPGDDRSEPAHLHRRAAHIAGSAPVLRARTRLPPATTPGDDRAGNAARLPEELQEVTEGDVAEFEQGESERLVPAIQTRNNWIIASYTSTNTDLPVLVDSETHGTSWPWLYRVVHLPIPNIQKQSRRIEERN